MAIEKCPNCNKELQLNELGECEYCGKNIEVKNPFKSVNKYKEVYETNNKKQYLLNCGEIICKISKIFFWSCLLSLIFYVFTEDFNSQLALSNSKYNSINNALNMTYEEFTIFINQDLNYDNEISYSDYKEYKEEKIKDVLIDYKVDSYDNLNKSNCEEIAKNKLKSMQHFYKIKIFCFDAFIITMISILIYGFGEIVNRLILINNTLNK